MGFHYFIIYFNLTWENDLGPSLKLRYLTLKFIHKIVNKNTLSYDLTLPIKLIINPFFKLFFILKILFYVFY